MRRILVGETFLSQRQLGQICTSRLLVVTVPIGWLCSQATVKRHRSASRDLHLDSPQIYIDKKLILLYSITYNIHSTFTVLFLRRLQSGPNKIWMFPRRKRSVQWQNADSFKCSARFLSMHSRLKRNVFSLIVFVYNSCYESHPPIISLEII